jgi:ferredoxin
MAKRTVDRERRIACGTCVGQCPTVLAIGDHKVAYIVELNE